MMLDGSGSDDGDGGIQGLSYTWTKLSGPAESGAIAAPEAAVTQVDFTLPGSYQFRLTVSDHQTLDSTAHADTGPIIVLPEEQAGPEFIRGDSDGSGLVDVTDAVATLGYLYLGAGKPACFDAADADDNGALELTDAVRILGYLFLGGGDLPAPSGVCGVDPTGDDPFGCERSACP